MYTSKNKIAFLSIVFLLTTCIFPVLAEPTTLDSWNHFHKNNSEIKTNYVTSTCSKATGPVWVANSAWDIPDVGRASSPEMIDLDGDGDYDLLVGEYSGVSYAYENTGNSSSPLWTANSTWNMPDIGNYVCPRKVDLDGDGDNDLLIGAKTGVSYAYENTGNTSNPVWTAKSAWNTPDIGTYCCPTVADLDGDGDYDLLVGATDGKTSGYENTGNSSSPVWTANSAWNVADVGNHAIPFLVDLDGDGDYDLLIGEEEGVVYGYENTGNVSSPSWTANSAWDVSYPGERRASPAAEDLDGDGDYDLIIGDYSGVSYGYENIPIPPVADFIASETTGYEPLTVTFTDNSTYNPSSWFWDFDGEGTVDSTEQNPVYTYTEPGTYSANLTAANGAGSNSCTVEIQVIQRPVAANFTTDVVFGEVPLTVTFTDTSTNASTSTPPDSWAWDFDNDGTVDSTEQNPIYTYTSGGRYTVNLTVSNSEYTDSNIATRYINAEGVHSLADSAWPKYQRDNSNSGLSQYIGPQTATLFWTYDTGDSISEGAAIDSEGTIYFGSDDKIFRALSPNGSLKWSYTASEEIRSTPSIAKDGTIYFGDKDGKLYALNKTGSLKWSYDTGSAISGSSPAIDSDGTVYFGCTDGKLYAIGVNGSLKWNYTTGDDIYSSPVIGSDGAIYVGSKDLNLYALNPDGSLKWSYTTSNYIYGSPAIGSDGTVYVGSYDNSVYALNPDDGSLKWSSGTASYSRATPGIGPDGTLYLGIFYGTGQNFYALYPENGSLKWSYTTSDAFSGAPVIGADGTIYSASLSGNVYAFNPDGSLKWSYATSDGYSGSLAIGSDGAVYVGSNSGTFYAFKDVAPAANFTASITYGQPPLTVNFTDTSTGTPNSWAWDFDNDGVTDSTEQNPSYNYTADGVYSVKLTASNVNGNNTVVKTDYIIVGSSGGDEMPVADFNLTPVSGQAPLTVNFSDTSLNGPRSWVWDFGDGSEGNTTNTTHTFTSVGLYNVTLTVTNIAGNDSVTKTVEVLENPLLKPDANFTYTLSGLVTPAYVEFTDTSTNSPESWLWDFGDNTTSTLQGPGHKYSTAGNYSVTLTTRNRYGSDTVTKYEIISVEEWVIPEGISNNSWPQFHGDEVHTGFAEGSAPETGNLLWVSDKIGAVSSSSVVVADGRIFVNCDPDIVSLDPKTGEYLSVHGEGNTKYGSWSSPAYDDGNVWCGVNPYPAGSYYYTVNGGSLVADGKVFTSNWDGGQYFAFDEHTNEELWNFTIDFQNDAVAAGSRAQGCPAYKDGRVYVTSWTTSDSDKHGFIYCLNADTGELIWKQNIVPPTCGSVMIHNDTLYLTTYGFDSTSASGLVALNITDGEVRWYNQDLPRSDSTPAYAYGNIYASGGCSGYSELLTCCFNATTGNLIWQTNASDSIGSWTCSPAVADGKVYVGPSGVNCLDAYTGEIIWQGSGGGGSPAIVDGIVYSVGGGRVYAYYTDESLPVAGFNASVISGVAPLTVNFTDTSVNASGWAWDFENDGIVDSCIQNPTHTYTTAGEYSVNLTVNNSYGTDSEIKTAFIVVTGNNSSAEEPPIIDIPVPDSSDTIMFQNNLYHTGVTSQAGPIEDPELAWAAYTGYMNTNPLVIGDLEVSACSGNLSVHNRTTGDCLWYNITGNGGMTGVGSNLGPICYGNGTLFFPESYNGALSAFDIRTGERLWRISGLGGTYSQTNTPVIYEDHKIYFGTWNGNPCGYYCYYDNGTECWSREGSGYYWAGAAIIGDYLVFGGEDMNLTSLDKNTGEEVQSISVPDTFSVVPSSGSQVRSSVMYDAENKRCYFTTVSGYCCALGFDESTGTFDLSDNSVSNIGSTTSTPSVYNGRLYVGVGRLGSSNTYLYCLNATDLTQIWKFTANGIIQSSPTVSTSYEDSTGNIYIYFTTNIANGNVYCLKDYSGNTNAIEAWNWTPPESMQQYVLAGAVLKQGYLYFGNNEGSTGGYTFALKGSGSDPVVADFSATPLSGSFPLTVNFTDLSTNAESWAWDFNGDGVEDSTDQNPSYNYTTPGTYSVKLNVTNSGGSDEEFKENYIHVSSASSGEGSNVSLNTTILPAISFKVSPSSLEFGELSSGKVSASQNLTLKNSGSCRIKVAAEVTDNLEGDDLYTRGIWLDSVLWSSFYKNVESSSQVDSAVALHVPANYTGTGNKQGTITFWVEVAE